MPNYADVKSVGRVAQELRGRTMHMIWNYRAWQSWHDEADIQRNPYLKMENKLLRRHISETYRLYRMAHAEYRMLYRSLVESLGPRKTPLTERDSAERNLFRRAS